MFNIGFSELVILAVIGLIVIGPEQLPELARKLAKILNELKRAKEEIMAPLDDLKHEAQASLMKFRQGIEDESQQINKNFEKINDTQVEKATKDHLATNRPPADNASGANKSITDAQKKTDS